ncbi:MAG TPA: aconitase family protein, partial [Nitrosopumilaceae archaeon]|nr:aconitase family protein [Nitrosopumilaceae archaeon]
MDIESTPELVAKVYEKTKENISNFRKKVGKPLTLTEKILAGHLVEIETKNLDEGANYVYLNPDRVALQDVTGQMVLLQFMQTGLKQTAIPTTVHCDHLIRAQI